MLKCLIGLLLSRFGDNVNVWLSLGWGEGEGGGCTGSVSMVEGFHWGRSRDVMMWIMDKHGLLLVCLRGRCHCGIWPDMIKEEEKT